MIFPEHRKLFTIREMSHACGVSRSTLIRMEEDGFLTPYHTDPDTGYRYYDLQNVAAVGQYQRLQQSGLSRKELADLYYERVDSSEFLKIQQQKLSRLQHFLDEYELRHDHIKNFSFLRRTLPAVTCYCTEITASSLDDCATQCFLAHETSVEEGYRMLGSEPLFGIGYSFDSMIHSTLCIPVVPDTEPGPRIRRFPSTEAFSVLAFGEFSDVAELESLLREEVDARGLEPSGPVRHIALVAPYAGAHFKSVDYCYEIAVPVTERKENPPIA